MYSIWKYEVEPDFVNQKYTMPKGATILSFGLDGNDQLCFWARVNTEAPKEEHLIACVGTGWPIDNMFNERVGKYVNFIGTVTHGVYVWHLFDLGAALGEEQREVATNRQNKEAAAHENAN